MDRTFFLAVGLSFAVLVLWTMYTESQEPATPPAPSPAAAPAAPEPGTAAAPAPELPAPVKSTAPPVEATTPEQRIAFRNELVDAEFSSWGGALVRWSLLRFDDPSLPGRPPVEITTAGADGAALATPLADLGLGDLSRAPYRVEQPDPETLVFTLERGGIRVRKTYLLGDAYELRLRIEVTNGSPAAVSSAFVTTWPLVRRESADYQEFSAAAYSDGELYGWFVNAPPAFLGMGPGAADEAVTLTGNVEWAGAHTRYFLAAILPENPRDASARFTPTEPGERALVEVGFARAELPPGGGLDREYRVYLGPKEPERLDAVGAHLDEAIAKGWF